MPRKAKVGRGAFMDFAKKANEVARRTQAISRTAQALADSGMLGQRGTSIASTVARSANALGYGRKRKGRGGLSLGSLPAVSW
jgi:hypothetical protein